MLYICFLHYVRVYNDLKGLGLFSCHKPVQFPLFVPGGGFECISTKGFTTICSPLGDSKPPPRGERLTVTVCSLSRHFLLSSPAALPVWCPGTAGSAGTHPFIHWAHLQANVNSFQNLSRDINSFFPLILVSGRPRLPKKHGTQVGAIKEIYSFLLQWGGGTVSHNKPHYSQVIDQLFVS